MPATTPVRSDLSRAIMRRVYLTYVLRRVFSRLGASVLIATVAAGVASQLVSVSAILNNARTVDDVRALVSFALSAFVGTTGLVQLLTLLCAAALAVMARELARAFSRQLPLVIFGLIRKV
jgi:hypothetical protein